jgi:hypothetical protein
MFAVALERASLVVRFLDSVSGASTVKRLEMPVSTTLGQCSIIDQGGILHQHF